MNKLKAIFKENKGLLMLVVLMVCFRSAVADWNEVPTGSMKPTIIEGDRIFVNKMAYDLRLPLTHISLHKFADPQRGDIIIFNSKVADLRLVKRVIGVPGDVIEMKNNRLMINGEIAHYSNLHSSGYHLSAQENILGFAHQMQILPNRYSGLSSFGPIRVPDKHYFALGDNRDNSADSRVHGFVPRNEIVGRTDKIVMSLDYENYYLPRSERFLKELQ